MNHPPSQYAKRFQEVLSLACARRAPIDLCCAHLFEGHQGILNWIDDNTSPVSIGAWMDTASALDIARTLILQTKPQLNLGGDASKQMLTYLQAKAQGSLIAYLESLDPAYSNERRTLTLQNQAGTHNDSQIYFVADTKSTNGQSMYLMWVSRTGTEEPTNALPMAQTYSATEIEQFDQSQRFVPIDAASALELGVRPFPSRIYKDFGPAVANTRTNWQRLQPAPKPNSAAPKMFYQGCARRWSTDWM